MVAVKLFIGEFANRESGVGVTISMWYMWQINISRSVKELELYLRHKAKREV